jgi:hypothetical protein
MTQAEQILHYLQQGGALTPLEALDMFGCFRLGARIWDLKREGHDIRTDMVDVGDGKHVAKYYLAGQQELFSKCFSHESRESVPVGRSRVQGGTTETANHQLMRNP